MNKTKKDKKAPLNAMIKTSRFNLLLTEIFEILHLSKEPVTNK